MPDPDTTKLEAVNSLLAIISEAPVGSLTVNPSLDVQMALSLLEEESRNLQKRGWHWNTDEEVTITADGQGRFQWHSDWFEFDLPRGRYTGIDVVRRGQYLWNRLKNTDVFEVTELTGTAVRYLDWDDLPEVARSYIMVRAKRTFAEQQAGDKERASAKTKDEMDAWAALEEHESEQGDHNIFDDDIYRLTYRPGGGGLRPGLPR